MLEIPVPLSVSASVPTLMPPCNWSAAPLVTEVPEAGSLLAVPPSALEFWIHAVFVFRLVFRHSRREV